MDVDRRFVFQYGFQRDGHHGGRFVILDGFQLPLWRFAQVDAGTFMDMRRLCDTGGCIRQFDDDLGFVTFRGERRGTRFSRIILSSEVDGERHLLGCEGRNCKKTYK